MSIEAQIQQAQSLEASGNLEAAAQTLLSLSFEGAQRYILSFEIKILFFRI
jgi:hypothetical protein